MRKWIVLAFVLGFIAGGVTLFFYLPSLPTTAPTAKVGTPVTAPDAAVESDIPPQPQQGAVDDQAQPNEDLGAPPPVITEDEEKPAPFAPHEDEPAPPPQAPQQPSQQQGDNSTE